MINAPRKKYFIHGNGQDSSCAPVGYLADDIPGHGHGPKWDAYSMESLTDYFIDKVPANALVLGHSLGGHIALNLALKRADINVIVCGMAPLESLEQIGIVMFPLPGFDLFQNPKRSLDDIRSFSRYSSLDNNQVLEKLVKATLLQDVNFNMKLFAEGIASYDWNEVSKAKLLGPRFKIIISKNEACYNADKLHELKLNVIEDNYKGHSPWLLDTAWVSRIERKSPIDKSKELSP